MMHMKSPPIIIVLGLKGGSGKSTLAIHLAVCSKRRALLADTDPQATLVAWSKTRELPEPTVKAVRSYDLATAVKSTNGNYDLIVVDTAPRIDADVPKLARLASLLVIPVRASMPDLVASQTAFRLAEDSKRPFTVVLNATDNRIPEVSEAHELLAKHYDVAPVMLGQRVAFSRALATGRAVSELEPAGKANEEITALWSYLERKL
jgi:chromosome partitioning protein